MTCGGIEAKVTGSVVGLLENSEGKSIEVGKEEEAKKGFTSFSGAKSETAMKLGKKTKPSN